MLGGLTKRLEQLKGKNLGVWTAGYARWLARARRAARARGARAPTPARATCCSRSAITTSRMWKNRDRRRRRRARARLAARLPGAGGPVPRRRRAAAAPSFFFPGEEYAPGYLDALASAGARAASARWSCTCTTTATPPPSLRRTIADVPGRSSPSTATCRATADGRAALRVHPRQLVPGQRAPRRPLVRRRRGAAAAVRDRLLRRLHVPGGARRIAAADRQPDLLARGRPRAAPRATDTGDAARASARCGAIAS